MKKKVLQKSNQNCAMMEKIPESKVNLFKKIKYLHLYKWVLFNLI